MPEQTDAPEEPSELVYPESSADARFNHAGDTRHAAQVMSHAIECVSRDPNFRPVRDHRYTTREIWRNTERPDDVGYVTRRSQAGDDTEMLKPGKHYSIMHST